MHARIHGRIHGPYMGVYMGHMGAAIGHACAHTWPYMGAAMGHACAHTWAIYRAIHGPHGSSNRAYMAIYGSSLIGRVGRKRIVENPFPTLFYNVIIII